jgi:hypothetical protein
MPTTFDRRTVLSLAAGAAAVSVAGCSSDQGNSTETETGGGTATDDADSTPTDDSEPATTDDAEQTATDGDEEYTNGVGDDASVSLAVPSDGTTLNSPYVQWDATASGVTIEESGEVNEGAGHYHLLVDTDPVPSGEVIPSDDQHVHYGTGQTDGVLELEPGDHTLVLQLADGEHRALPLTDSVEVTVEDTASLDLSTTVDGSVVEWEITPENYTIESSSEIASNAGHLHAVVDTDHVDVGAVIPTDANHVHYGDGSTSGSIDLAEQLGDAYEPGEHTIHFQVGSGSHRATMVHAHTTVDTE